MSYLAADGCDYEEAEHPNWYRERHALGWRASHNRPPSGGVVEGKARRRKDGQGNAKHSWDSLRSSSTRNHNAMLVASPAAPTATQVSSERIRGSPARMFRHSSSITHSYHPVWL